MSLAALFATTILPALLPAAVDGVKNIIEAKTRPPVPLSPADQVALADADVRRIEALAQLDATAGPIHQWVNDIRALQRPAAVTVILGAYVYGSVAGLDAAVVDRLADFASMVTFYLFGERAYRKMRIKP